MTEILFRGKRTDNGEWVEGYLTGLSYNRYIKDINDHTTNPRLIANNYADIRCVQVVPETVGQFTGLLDKNGKKIFEGDIIRNCLDNETLNIEFDTRTAQFSAKTRWLWTMIGLCEVIGNIHDKEDK